MNAPLILIAAVARNGVIGGDNALPWHLPEDLRHFKALTTGHVVIMGRKTWESLPERFRPLPDRLNIVVTRNADYRAAGATVVHSLAEAQKVGAGGTAAEETRWAAPSVSSPPGGRAPHSGAYGGGLFVIGGAELYAHALPLAERLELTEIAADFPGDALFPPINATEWCEIARISQHAAAGLDFSFVTYTRISPGMT